MAMSNGHEIARYYAMRAREYERVYEKPERQNDLARLKEIVGPLLASHVVLEVACGTGFWTQVISEKATFVTALDVSDEVLDIARQKPITEGKVEFKKADAFRLSQITGQYTAAFAAFWWSHIPKESVTSFLQSLHHPLTSGSLVAFVDNRYIPGNSTPITDCDKFGNTYQTRRLSDGTEHRIIKNYPSKTELQLNLGAQAESFQFQELQYYWYATYRVKKEA